MDVSTPPPALSQATGHGIVVGLGVAFAIGTPNPYPSTLPSLTTFTGMVIVTKLLKKNLGEDNKTTETFMVANRSVGMGLTASAVISPWMYSTALLGSPYLTYWYGIALPVRWANG